jgi:hypothetical protein
LSSSDSQLITFGATDTGEPHIFGGSARVNGDLIVNNANAEIVNGSLNFSGSGSAGSTNPAIYRVGANAMAFSLNSSEAMRITSSGNVLIGTTTDDGVNKLQVSGSVTFSNSILAGGDIILGDYSTAADKLISMRSFNTIFDISVNGDTSAGEIALSYSFANGSQGDLVFKRAAGDVLRLASTGAATFSSSVNANEFRVVSGNSIFLNRPDNGADSYIFTNASNELVLNTATGGQFKVKGTGVVNIASIPTSSAGLSAGDIWSDGGTLKIV